MTPGAHEFENFFITSELKRLKQTLKGMAKIG